MLGRMVIEMDDGTDASFSPVRHSWNPRA
jgi:hypothetical protein